MTNAAAAAQVDNYFVLFHYFIFILSIFFTARREVRGVLGGSLAAGARIMPHLPSRMETIKGIKCLGTVEHGHVHTGILAERWSVTTLPRPHRLFLLILH